ncbi:DNA repair protein RadA, partial [bacterium]
GGEWASGNTIVPTTQGTRPLLVEVQSLLIPARFNYPQRVSTGIDYRRLNMLIAITEKRLGLGIGGYDIFCNITGGLKVDEPAIDLGIIFSMVSGFIDKPIDRDTALAGEVGLGGEVRAIPFIDMRVKECKRLGLSRIIIPDQRTEGIDGIEVVKVRNIQEAKEALF